MISYGANVYRISKTECCDMLFNKFLSSIFRNKEKSPIFEGKKQKSPLHESLISEGLKLLKNVNSEKAEELRFGLEKLKKNRSEKEIQKSPIDSRIKLE